tara:strand:+ start:601 stop:1527 length:927 start_codon:yes stop_codon:yes gene_type:complete
MNNLLQKTILKSLSFKGIGLHSGKNSNIKIIPAENNKGIVFKRIDLPKDNIIEANFKNVSSAKLCTTLKNNFGNSVSTVEHLLAAFYIVGIDNAIVEVDNKEVPIMDGSSKDFVEKMSEVGLKNLTAKRKFLKIAKKIEYEEDKKYISIEPSNDEFEVNFKLDYNNEIIGCQTNTVNFNKDNLKDIYSSRTFCLYEDIEKIKEIGLAKGGSLDNAVVVKNKEVLNTGGLRNKKEFVNHKILDLAGDFLLSGFRVIGKVKCVQGGHLLTNTFLKELFLNASNFEQALNNTANISKNNFKTPINKIAVNA